MRKVCLLTGSESMIGRFTKKELLNNNIDVSCTGKVDLTNQKSCINTVKRYTNDSTSYLMHLAGYNGGIEFNKKYPADIFYNTVMMGLNVIHETIVYCKNLEKIVFIMPSCALEPQESESFEYNLYSGPAHPSVECHGLAKRAVEAYGRQIEKQYGIKFVSCIANNSFGPHDRFDEERGKVISGMIKKFVTAKELNQESITLWGTGSPLREFIYAKDIAVGLVQVLLNYNEVEPINLTSDFEISIKDLSYTIADIVGYKGQIIFDTTKQDGQMRKKLNSDKMHKHLNMEITPFKQALEETINWYIRYKA